MLKKKLLPFLTQVGNRISQLKQCRATQSKRFKKQLRLSLQPTQSGYECLPSFLHLLTIIEWTGNTCLTDRYHATIQTNGELFKRVFDACGILSGI